MECYIGQVIEPTFGGKLTLVNCNIQKKILTINIWEKQTSRHLVVKRHLCLERKRGDNYSTNRVLKISEAY